MTIAESWAVIADASAPAAPGTKEDVAAVEEAVGASLPEDVKESLLLHDGLGEAEAWELLPGSDERPLGGWILSCEEIRDEWGIWKDLYDQDNDEWADEWWTPNLVPLVSDGAGNSLCADVKNGGLVDMDHEMGPTRTGFGSWADYLATVAANVEGRAGASGVWA